MVKLFQKVIALVVVLFVTSCVQKKNYPIYEGISMTMGYKVIIGEPTPDRLVSLIAIKINEVFNTTNKTFNNWNPESEISIINGSPANKKIPVSKALFEFLEYTKLMCIFTDGLFDPTILPLKNLWISKLKFNSLPSSSELHILEEAIGFDNICLDSDSMTVMKKHNQTTVDLCGISKGYTVDLIADALDLLNIHNYYIEWGGEIKTSGKHPSGRLWQVVPLKTLDTTIEIGNTAVASSGNYLQNWNVDGITYTHLIHPKKKKPLTINKESIQATTVIHQKCCDADALATTLMLFDSVTEAQRWAEQHKITAYIKSDDSLE